MSFDRRLEENLLELMEDLFNTIVDSTGSAGSKSKQGLRMKPRGVFKGVGVRKSRGMLTMCVVGREVDLCQNELR